MSTLIDKANEWTPRSGDACGTDKKIFLNYLLKNCVGFNNSEKIENILEILKPKFKKKYSKESLQHLLLVPLREEIGFFVGTSSRGIYFVKDAEDAFTTINFYSNRIRSEEKHLRNLKVIVQKNKLFRNYKAGKKLRKPANIYIDESGTPDVTSYKEDPYFIVTGVVLDCHVPYNLLEQKLTFIRKLLNKPPDYEFKSNKLSAKEHKTVLNELRTVDYEFASVCFVKERLLSQGFKQSSSFYKYANFYLVEKLLDRLGKVNLYFDQYGDPNSTFESEFLKYIKSKSDIWPEDKIQSMTMLDSKSSHFIQIADLIAGAVSKSLRGKGNYLTYIEEKKVDVYMFPY
jgi:hypothetical protein